MSCAGNCYSCHVGVSIGNITTGSLFSRLGVGGDDGLFCTQCLLVWFCDIFIVPE